MNNTYQDAIENSNIVSKTDINGIITFVNDEFCKISGYSYKELIGQNHNIVRHPDISVNNFKELWETILSKKAYKATVKNLRKDGKTVYLNTTITPILDKNHNIKEFIAIRYDVTKEVELKKDLLIKEKELEELNSSLEERIKEQTKELKELNTNLERKVKKEVLKNKEKQKLLLWQSRMASLGQMLGNIAHQWRQPLTELNLSLFSLKKASKDKNEKKFDKYYGESKVLIQNMSNTIDDFTNFFNPQKEKKSFNITESICESQSILKKVIKKENIHLNINIKDNCSVVGVPSELSQVLINLILNAKDAYNENKIENKLLNISLKKVIFENNTLCKIEVSDQALGINEKNIDKIFEPYFTTKYQSQGTGLGLFMSKMIIEQGLEGRIEHKNSLKGSIFTIYLPMD